MKLDWLKARQTKYGAYAATYIAVIVAVLSAANYLADRHNKSFDLTKNKRYSLSDQTDKIVKGLKQDVTITYFDRGTEFQRARDLLDRYDKISPRLKVDYVDLEKKPQLARSMGVRSLGTTYVQAGAKREEAKSVTEEEITGAIIRALKSGERNACFVTGSGERSIDDSGRGGLSTMRETLEKNNYKTRSISLLEKPEVPKDCTVLMVIAPMKDYLPAATNAIKSYVEAGGRALFLIEPPIKMGRSEPSENPELVNMLSGWGVTLDKGLVLEDSPVGQMIGLGPQIPLVANYESQAIVRDMKGTATIFPLSRALETKSTDKTTVEKLFETSDRSFATTNLNSNVVTFDAKKDKKGPLTLAAAGTYNTGKAGTQGRFVVVGSADWAGNGVLPARQFGNRDLFLNAMNWLSSDEDLISIRPKDPEDQSFVMTTAQRNLVFYWSILVLPLAVVFGGFMVWWKRR
ncbi:MAG: GldG family protein [Acidobacteriota bacterium]